jgi:hypothetical protein
MGHIKGETLCTKGAQEKGQKIKIRAAGRNGFTIQADFGILGFWNRRLGREPRTTSKSLFSFFEAVIEMVFNG